MAPSAIAEHPVKGEVIVPKLIEIIPLAAPDAPRKKSQFEELREIKPAFEFSQAVLLDENHFKTGSRPLKLAVSIITHVALISVPILLGLFFTDTINIKQYAAMMLVAPPPPPPPPPPATAALVKTAPRQRFINSGKLFAPTVIPKAIAEIKEAPDTEGFEGVAGGVPGGVPGGQMGGVLGGVIGGVLNTGAKPLAPPPPTKAAPVRVGGRVRPPKAILQVQPTYPVLARQARIQGQVQIDAVLDEQGNVIEMKIVSGPPLLYQAALDALKRWKYEPTYLNDQPIAVQMIVNVTFVLGQ